MSQPKCSKCGSPADFKFSRPTETTWGDHVWPMIPEHYTCLQCFQRDYPDEIEVEEYARLAAEKLKRQQ